MSSKNRLHGAQKVFRAIGLWGAFLAIVSSITLITMLSLNLMEVVPLEANGPREYWVQFVSEDRILFDKTYRRGEEISKPSNPTHSEDEYYMYIFRGWDITDDNTPDIIPSHAYFSFLAVAVYQRRQIKPLPPSSNPGDSSEEGESSENDNSSLNEEGNYLIGAIYG